MIIWGKHRVTATLRVAGELHMVVCERHERVNPCASIARMRSAPLSMRLLIGCAVLVTAAAAVAPQPLSTRSRVVLLSIDGGADWIVDRLVEEGKAPALAAMAREGAVAAGVVTVMPSLTAVTHASIWTGTLPRYTGVTGNILPRTPPAEHSLLETRSGYLAPVLQAEPIWTTAARAGRRVLIAQGTAGYPFRTEHRELISQFDVYANELLSQEIVRGRMEDGTLHFTVGETTVAVTLDGVRAVRVTAGDVSARVTRGSAGYSPPLRAVVGAREGLFRVGLLRLDPANGDVVLLRGDVFQVNASDLSQRAAFLAEAGVAIGEGGDDAYQSGNLGPTLAEGGDGSAEQHLIDAAVANQAYFDGALRYAATQAWDLLVLYVPNLDMLGHALVGMLDPASARYHPELAARVWPIYEEGFRRCADDFVGRIRTLLPDATLVVTADHGMEGNGRVFRPNAVLRDAGLLAVNEQGRIDPARSRAIFLYSHGGGVYVNTTRWRDGVVAESDRASVKQAAAGALLGARDPASGVPLVRAVFDPDIDGEALGIGGPYAPDLYVDSAVGYQMVLTPGSGGITAPGRPAGYGAHGLAPWRRNLHAIFYAAGPRVQRGTTLGMIRTIDVAPTVSRLLGIPPPEDAIGLPLPIVRAE